MRILRAEFYVFVNVADIEPERLREVVAQSNVDAREITEPDAVLGVYSVTIVDDPAGAERLREALRREGVDSFFRQERFLSDEEILAAPLSSVRIERQTQALGGPSHGTTFSFDSACPRCGTGARPVGDVVLGAGDVPKRGDVFQTLMGERFVSDRLREEFARGGFTGAGFHDARTAGEPARLPWLQLVPAHELPPADPSSVGLLRENPCPDCDRDGWFHTVKQPLQLTYSLTPAEHDALPDFLSTWEHFGLSRLAEPIEDSAFAQPLLVVKPRVVKMLKDLKVRGLLFDPVEIV